MFNALSIAATGLQAQQLNVETVANNIANANTPGFKKQRVGFTELVTQATQPASAAGAAGAAGAVATAQAASGGMGVSVASLVRLFEPGELQKTESPLDVAIRGEGFLEVATADGTTAYSRAGTFKVNRDGLLATASGAVLKPPIAVHDNAQGVVIAADGSVQITPAGGGRAVQAGQLQLVRFANPTGLEALGEGLFKATDVSGEPQAVRAGEDGAGTFAQGWIEQSNVKMLDEVVNLMLAQRAYESSLKVVQAADEMLGMVNNLRK